MFAGSFACVPIVIIFGLAMGGWLREAGTLRELALVADYILITLYFITLVYAVRDLRRRPELNRHDRDLWIVVLLFGNVLTLPAWWWKFIRPLSGSNPTHPRRAAR